MKLVSGSEGPKKSTPIPMPAAKSIATQAKVLNSGVSPSFPRGIRP